MTRRKTGTTENSSEISLEAAMSELGQIVTRLESGTETLDESLAIFEKGMGLLRLCQSRLDAAAQRIEIVTRFSADGTVETAEFDSTSTMQKATDESGRSATRNPRHPSDTKTGDDEALLF